VIVKLAIARAALEDSGDDDTYYLDLIERDLKRLAAQLEPI